VREQRAIGILLFCAFILLTTCQLQFNKAGNGLALRIVVPASSDGSTSIPALGANGKYLLGGTSVTVMITTQVPALPASPSTSPGTSSPSTGQLWQATAPL